MAEDFLPTDYKVPNDSKYMKLIDGENRFRVLSKPIIGWLDWLDKKPLRYKMDAKPERSQDPDKPIRHFWAFVVFNYAEEKIQVLELTQKGIMNSIKSLADDPDWGNPAGYDIKIVRSGSGRETEYEVKPVPHSTVADGIQDLFGKTAVNLEALYEGKDPFATGKGW